MLRKVRARRIAEGLLREFKIKKAPVDIEGIVKKLPARDIPGVMGLNLVITEERFPSDLEDVSAILLKEKGQAIIAVNNGHSDTRKRFSIAHEVGHLIMHSNHEQLTVDRYEKQFFTRAAGHTDLNEIEANEFAAALLMPEDLIRKDFEKYFDEDSDQVISNLAEKYQVSQAALTYRLKNLGLL